MKEKYFIVVNETKKEIYFASKINSEHNILQNSFTKNMINMFLVCHVI